MPAFSLGLKAEFLFAFNVVRFFCLDTNEHAFNMDVNSPDIPALSFYPQATQALSARLIPEDKVCGINTWPLLCYQGQDELAAYPPVHKLDEQVSGEEIQEDTYNSN